MATIAPEHHERLLDNMQLSLLKRSARAEIRRRLRTGQLSLTELVSDPPPEMEGVVLVDVLRMLRDTNRERGQASLAAIGRRAVVDGVNLMVPLGTASARSRAWVAEHGLLGVHQARWPS